MGKKRKPEGHGDYISELSNDILASILSCMSMKDAACTSVLSKRWEKLWLDTPRLDFEKDAHIVNCEERQKFINQVNNIMRNYKRKKLDYLRICYDLDHNLKRDIDNWFMFMKDVNLKNLILDFVVSHLPNYPFPQIGTTMFQPLQGLETLSLRFVKIEQDALDCLLSCCPLLESLSLRGALRGLKFSGLSLKLKYLDIFLSNGHRTIEIYEINLVSFSYRGHLRTLTIRNVPKLEKIFVTFPIFEKRFFDMVSECPGLHSLTLDLTMLCGYPYLGVSSLTFLELSSIKELMVGVGVHGYENLQAFTSLVHACPNLDKFVLQLNWKNPFVKKYKKPKEAVRDHAHPNLKIVEIKGYFGHKSAGDLAMYFMKNAINLQKLVIDPCEQEVLSITRWGCKEDELSFKRKRERPLIDYSFKFAFNGNHDEVLDIEKAEMEARTYAKRLLNVTPSTVELVIL